CACLYRATATIVVYTLSLHDALPISNGFTDSGVIELTSVVNAQSATLNVSACSLVHAPAAQINALAGTGGARTLGVQLDNRGTRSEEHTSELQSRRDVVCRRLPEKKK